MLRGAVDLGVVAPVGIGGGPCIGLEDVDVSKTSGGVQVMREALRVA